MAMNRSRIGYLLVLLSLTNVPWSQAQKTGGATEKTVTAREQTWLQSQKTSNPDLLAPLVAHKFVNTGSDGTVTAKAETLALVKMMKFDSGEYYDVQVTVFGGTAIATGGVMGEGADTSCQPRPVKAGV